MKYKSFYSIISIIGLWLFSSNVMANQFIQMKNIEVHYVVFNSTFLTPKIARQYQLKRNPNSAIINLSILDSSQLGKPAISANIKGEAKNLLGQTKKLNFTRYQEGDAIYYLATLPFTDQEEFNFKIDVHAGSAGSGILRFNQKLYSEQ